MVGSVWVIGAASNAVSGDQVPARAVDRGGPVRSRFCARPANRASGASIEAPQEFRGAMATGARGGDHRHDANARAYRLVVERVDQPAPIITLADGEIHA